MDRPACQRRCCRGGSTAPKACDMSTALTDLQRSATLAATAIDRADGRGRSHRRRLGSVGVGSRRDRRALPGGEQPGSGTADPEPETVTTAVLPASLPVSHPAFFRKRKPSACRKQSWCFPGATGQEIPPSGPGGPGHVASRPAPAARRARDLRTARPPVRPGYGPHRGAEDPVSSRRWSRRVPPLPGHTRGPDPAAR